MQDAPIAKLVRVAGRVQGVAYRAWTQREAEAIGLRGWVRNEPDGTVTAMIVGPEDATRRLIEAMRSGPPGAEVTGLQSAAVAIDETLVGFEIRG